MKAVSFSDEKLYRISAPDYGDPFHRAFGVILHSLIKGAAIAACVAFFLLAEISIDLGRHWFLLFAPLTVLSSVWAAFSDRPLYLCEIEIFSDRIVRHSGDKTLGIRRDDVLTIEEGGHWTLFGWVNGLTICSKSDSIFVPAGAPEYVEIRLRLGNWRPPGLGRPVRFFYGLLHR